MPWVEITDEKRSSRERRNRVASQPSRRMKLYADEDIEEDVIDYLRERGVNVQSARALGHVPRADDFHAAYARKKSRFLLTKNGKHFLSNHRLPFHKCYGVIVIDGSNARTLEYGAVLWFLITWIIPNEDSLLGSKIEISQGAIKVHYIDDAGQQVTDLFRMEGNKVFVWEDAEAA